MSTRPKVLRVGKVEFALAAWERLSRVADIVECTATSREEFIQELHAEHGDISAITRTLASVAITGPFDKALVKELPSQCGAIANCGAGYDAFDVAALSERGIQLSNVPSAVDDSTADTALYLMLSAMRRFQQGHQGLMEGKWPTQRCAGALLGHDPVGKTLGIIGMGGIGREIRDRAKGFGFSRMVYYNRTRLDCDLEDVAEYMLLDLLLAHADIIFLSLPLNPKTRGLINRETIAKMKDGVVVINTARGGIIDEPAFIEALQSGKIAAAGLDVYENEPNPNRVLLELPNVTSVPHMGSHTYETIQAMEECVVENVELFLRCGKVDALVPEQAKVSFGN